METAARGRLPVLSDFVTGRRTSDIGGPPGTRTVEAEDLLLVDLVPRVGLYWGDSCATVALGEPPTEVREAHSRVLEALDLGEVPRLGDELEARAGDALREEASVIDIEETQTPRSRKDDEMARIPNIESRKTPFLPYWGVMFVIHFSSAPTRTCDNTPENEC